MADLFTVEIVSPDRIFYQGEASFIEMVTTEGEIGVYKKHIPMTNILVPGVVTIHEENEVKKAAVHAGFVEILPEKVTILAEIAEWPDEINVARAEEAKERAERRLNDGGAEVNIARAEAALSRSLARLNISGKL